MFGEEALAKQAAKEAKAQEKVRKQDEKKKKQEEKEEKKKQQTAAAESSKPRKRSKKEEKTESKKKGNETDETERPRKKKVAKVEPVAPDLDSGAALRSARPKSMVHPYQGDLPGIDHRKSAADIAYSKLMAAEISDLKVDLGSRKSFTVASRDRKGSWIGVLLVHDSFYVYDPKEKSLWPESYPDYPAGSSRVYIDF